MNVKENCGKITLGEVGNEEFGSAVQVVDGGAVGKNKYSRKRRVVRKGGKSYRKLRKRD